MGQPRVKWGDVKQYFEARGFTIDGSGGDKIIKAPPNWQGKEGQRNFVLIGHRFCSQSGDEISKGYLSSIKRAFGVSAQDILNG